MNPTLKYDLTIIVPVFNERENITRQEAKISDYLNKSLGKTACIYLSMTAPQIGEILCCGKHVADIMTFKAVK